MNLKKKRALAAKTLGVGEGRVLFNNERLDEIKEALTKQDMRDLFASGAILIKEIKGSRKVERRKTRRRAGSIRQKVRARKRGYIMLTRKFRAYIKELRKHGKIKKEQYDKLRNEIRSKMFGDKIHLKERIQELIK